MLQSSFELFGTNFRINNGGNEHAVDGDLVLGLLALELLADGVADDLVPVHLGLGHRQQPPQGLEGRVGHRLVVLRDRSLVLGLGVFHKLDQVLGRVILVL